MNELVFGGGIMAGLRAGAGDGGAFHGVVDAAGAAEGELIYQQRTFFGRNPL